MAIRIPTLKWFSDYPSAYSALISSGAKLLRVSPRLLVLLIVPLLIVGLWQISVVISDTPAYIMPRPTDILHAFFDKFGALWERGRNTATIAILGVSFGATTALIAGWLVSRYRWMSAPLLGYATAMIATPLMVTAPIFYVWLGLTSEAKIGLTALGTAPVMFIAAVRGFGRYSEAHELIMRSYAASYRQSFWHVYLPSALPSIFSGLKVAVSIAMIIAIVSDFFGGGLNLLGTYIRVEAAFLRNANAWSAALVACIIGLFLYSAVSVAERIVVHWEFRSRQL